MGGWCGFVAEGRGFLAMRGQDARAVLQGVVTNDIAHAAVGRAVYAALLTPQGKYLFDFLVSAGADGALRIEVAADRAAALAARLRLYCLRRDARVAPEPGAVALAWGGDPTALPALPAGVEALADPRAAALGLRIHAPGREAAAAALAALGAAAATPADYAALRVAEAVPETGIELLPDETFILEAGFERLGGVDFRKGCYVGQEVTARMKHRTELRRGLVRVRVEGTAEPGTPVVTADGRPAGTLHSCAGGIGLAQLRLDRAEGPLHAGAARLAILAG